MSKLSKVLIVVVVVQAVCICLLLFWNYMPWGSDDGDLRTDDGVEVSVDSENGSADEIPVVEKMQVEKRIIGTLVWWDQDDGFESLKEYGGYFYAVTPFWYQLGESGTVTKFSGAEDEEVLAFLRANDIKILPMISNEFEREPLASILADKDTRDVHVAEIRTLVSEMEYDGVSLNYENLDPEDRENFSLFVAELADVLHEDNKLLSVHLHAKVSEPGTWNGPQSQDWAALGESADMLKIMAYDYHWSTSEAGAIAPVSWVRDVSAHAVDLIPAEKVYLGVALYGYDWVGSKAKSLTHTEVMELVDRVGAAVVLNEVSKCPTFEYTADNGDPREVWFENSESVGYKLNVVDELGLAGVSLFRLGDEDESVYPANL